jgi:hypothetical protein
MSRKTTITGEGIRDETVDSADIASGSIKAGELSAQSISGQATITSTDTTNDRLLIFDATDSALKQISIGNLGVSASPAGSDGQIQYNNGGSAGGAANLYWSDSNNRLGIGTNNPSKALDIEDADSAGIQLNATNHRAYTIASDAYGFVVHDNTTGGTAGYRFVISDQAAALGYVGIGAGASIAGSNHPDALLHLSSSDDGAIFRADTTDGATVLSVTGSNRVGIGTASPTNTLHVYTDIANAYAALIDNDASSAGHGLKVTSDGIGSGTYILDLESASTTVLRVRGDGRVGIGKVASLPSAALTVSGSSGDADIAVAKRIQHIGDSDTYIDFEDDTITIAAGGRNFIKIEESSTDKLTINNGGLDIDLKVSGENNANLIRTDAENDSVYFGASSSAGVDNNFWVSGSIGSKGTAVRGTAVFGGDAVISGSLHVKGGNTVGGATSAAIILDSTTASKIVWDSEEDGNSPDASVYESGGSLYLSSSNDVRIYAGTDDILLYPKDMLQIIEDKNASGNFVSFFAQPSAGVYYNVLDVGDTGVIINDDSRADYDFRVESDSNTHMLFVDGGTNSIGVNTSTPGSGLEVNSSFSVKVTPPKTSAYTIAEDDFCIVGDCNSASITLTLPSATDAMAGRIYTIKRLDSGASGGSNTLTISRNGKNIDGAAGDVLLANQDALVLQCIGASVGWIRIGSFMAPL